MPLSSSSALNTLIVRSGCLAKNQCDLCFDGSLCCFGPLAQHVSRFTCGDPPGRTATVTPLQQKLLRCSLSPATHSTSLSSLRSHIFCWIAMRPEWWRLSAYFFQALPLPYALGFSGAALQEMQQPTHFGRLP